MLTLGHTGITLLVYAPIAYVLLVSGREKAMGTGLLVVLLLTPFPDVDMLVPFLDHRGITHSLLAAVGLGVAVAVAGWMSSLGAVASGSQRAGFGFFLGSFSVVSHLLGDVITPMGIRLFFPASETWYTVNLVSAADPQANRTLFVLGVVAFWMTIHRGRLRLAARKAAADRSSARSVADHPDGTEHGRPGPADAPIRSGTPSRDRAGTDFTALETGD